MADPLIDDTKFWAHKW